MWALSYADDWHGLLSAGNGPLFIAVNASMYGMHQHNYSLLYYTHLNTADNINTLSGQNVLPTHSRARTKGFVLVSSSRFKQDSEAMGSIELLFHYHWLCSSVVSMPDTDVKIYILVLFQTRGFHWCSQSRACEFRLLHVYFSFYCNNAHSSLFGLIKHIVYSRAIAKLDYSLA